LPQFEDYVTLISKYQRSQCDILAGFNNLGYTVMTDKVFKPGQIAPRSAQYGVVGPRGGKTGSEITGVKGKPLPPTPQPGMGYTMDDKTKHKSNK
jgi:hypothetical protein